MIGDESWTLLEAVRPLVATALALSVIFSVTSCDSGPGVENADARSMRTETTELEKSADSDNPFSVAKRDENAGTDVENGGDTTTSPRTAQLDDASDAIERATIVADDAGPDAHLSTENASEERAILDTIEKPAEVAGSESTNTGDPQPDALNDEEESVDLSETTTATESFFPIGERLSYTGFIKKAGVEFQVGSAEFEVRDGRRGRVEIESIARASKFGYSLDTTLTSVVERDGSRPVRYTYEQSGSENRKKKLVFGDGTARYIRYKHCMEPDCKDEEHFITRRVYAGGIIPNGEETLHCDDRDCPREPHQHWKVRHEHEFESAHFDMLTAVYIARRTDIPVGGTPKTIYVINDHDRWGVKIHAKKLETIEVPAGKFESKKIVLEPVAAKGTDPDSKFEGLFGLNGSIEIWLDRETNIPLKVEGDLPFGFVDLRARVELSEIGAIPAPEPSSDTPVVAEDRANDDSTSDADPSGTHKR